MRNDYTILNTVAATHADVVVSGGNVTITGITDGPILSGNFVKREKQTGVGVTSVSSTATTTTGQLDAGSALTVGRVYKVTVGAVNYYAAVISLAAGTNYNVCYLGPQGSAPNVAATAIVTYEGDGSVLYTFSSVANSTTYGATANFVVPTLGDTFQTWYFTTDSSASTTEAATAFGNAISNDLNAASYYVGVSSSSVYIRIPASTVTATYPLVFTNISGGSYGSMPTPTTTAVTNRVWYGTDALAYGYPQAVFSTQNGAIWASNTYTLERLYFNSQTTDGQTDLVFYDILINTGDANAAALVSYIDSTFA